MTTPRDNGCGGPVMDRRYWLTPRGYAALQQATPHTPPPEHWVCEVAVERRGCEGARNRLA